MLRFHQHCPNNWTQPFWCHPRLADTLPVILQLRMNTIIIVAHLFYLPLSSSARPGSSSDSKVVSMPGGQLSQEQVQTAGTVPRAAPLRTAHALPAHELRQRSTARLCSSEMTNSVCGAPFVGGVPLGHCGGWGGECQIRLTPLSGVAILRAWCFSLIGLACLAPWLQPPIERVRVVFIRGWFTTFAP